MKSAIVNIITATALALSNPLEGVESGKESIGAVVDRSGGNLSELEAALSKAKGSDREFLLTHVSQYALVNLTAEAIRAWLWGMDADSVKRVKFQNAENCLRSPVEILRGGVAACGELAVLHVSFLRAVGIPARHCCTDWWQGGKDGWYFYTEYWDNQKKCWVAIDDVAVPPSNRVKSGNWSTFTTYAAPGFNECANGYYTEDFSKLINVTANLGEVASFRFPADGTNDGSAAISVWNTLGWRKATIPEADAKEDIGYNFTLGKPKNTDGPGLMTVVKDGKLFWGLASIGMEDEEPVLREAEVGVCLRWPAMEVGR